MQLPDERRGHVRCLLWQRTWSSSTQLNASPLSLAFVTYLPSSSSSSSYLSPTHSWKPDRCCSQLNIFKDKSRFCKFLWLPCTTLFYPLECNRSAQPRPTTKTSLLWLRGQCFVSLLIVVFAKLFWFVRTLHKCHTCRQASSKTCYPIHKLTFSHCDLSTPIQRNFLSPLGSS